MLINLEIGGYTMNAENKDLNPQGWILEAAKLASEDPQRDPEERQDWASFTSAHKKAVADASKPEGKAPGAPSKAST
jgi:hypothetical protein